MAHAPIDGGSIGPVQVIEPATAKAEQPAWRRSARFAWKLFLLGVAGVVSIFGAAIALARVPMPRMLAIVLSTAAWGFATALFALGVIWSVVALVRIARSKDSGGGSVAVPLVVVPLIAGAFFSFWGAFITLWATAGFARGRQLRRRGKVLLPPIVKSPGWSRIAMSLSIPDELRAPLAARWRENARTEHASVAAFARLTLDLVALGAPADLIEAANRDARDEIRHADLCFSIARALDGQSEGPGPFPRSAARGRVAALEDSRARAARRELARRRRAP